MDLEKGNQKTEVIHKYTHIHRNWEDNCKATQNPLSQISKQIFQSWERTIEAKNTFTRAEKTHNTHQFQKSSSLFKQRRKEGREEKNEKTQENCMKATKYTY